MRRRAPVAPAAAAVAALALTLVTLGGGVLWAQTPTPRSLGSGTGVAVPTQRPGMRLATPGPNERPPGSAPVVEGRRPLTPEESATARAQTGPPPDVASRPGETVEQAHRRAGLLPVCELQAGKPARVMVRGRVREFPMPAGACQKMVMIDPGGSMTMIELADGGQAAIDREGRVLTADPRFDWLREALR
jgi:hypothetical protein